MTEFSTPPAERYKITFTPGLFEIIRAASAERISRSLRDNQIPNESDVAIIGMEEPYIRVRDMDSLRILAERMIEYKESTSHAIVMLAADCPLPLARTEMQVRETNGMLAQVVADKLREEIAYVEAVSPSEDADDWLRDLNSGEM